MSLKFVSCFAMAAAAGLILVTAGPAAAHVTVQPGEATRGGFAKLAFRVPNESETAGTIRLEVTFPLDTPLASLRTRPTPGWTARIGKEKLASPVRSGEREITEAVRTIVWTAEPGVRIGPGEFTEFEVSGGPLPENVDRLVLPATQTYDDGTVVNWDAPPPADGTDEPEHPAPVLKLASPAADGPAASPVANAATGRDDTARWLGGIGLAVGALGVGLAGGAVLGTRRRSSSSSGGGS